MSQDLGDPETPVSQIHRESKDSAENKSSKKHRHREESGERKRSKKHKSEDSPEKSSSKKHRDSHDTPDKKHSKKHKSHDSQEKRSSKNHRHDSEDSQEKRSSKKRKHHDHSTAPISPEATTTPEYQNKRPRLEANDETKEPSVAGAPEVVLNGVHTSPVDSLSQNDTAIKKTAKSHSKRARVVSPKHNHEPQEPFTQSADSPFFTQTTSFYLPLSPIAQSSPLDGLCAEHLSPLILTYSHPLDGVILSYSNPRFSSQPPSQHGEDETVLLRSIDEYGVTYVWVTADFVVLRPEKDTWIKGYISVQSESHIGLVCWNLFNASIERDKLPKQWAWVGGALEKSQSKSGASVSRSNNRNHADGGGHWVDGNGHAIDGPISFRVKSFESLPAFGRDKNFMSIEGTLLSKEEEEEETEPSPGERAGEAAHKRMRGKHAATRRSISIED